MKLISPSLQYAESLESALQEFEVAEIFGFWCIGGTPKTIQEYVKNIQNLEEAKVTIANEWVKASTFWLIDNGEFIGHTNIRHEIPGKLAERGGHIGYAIRPSKQKQGYGKKILELALIEAKKLGLKKILLTCDDKNIASQKTIEANGGVLENIIELDGEMIRRYWIEIIV